MDNVPNMVMDPDPTLVAMLRGRTFLYVQECKIKNSFGFGISFECMAAFHPLPVSALAAMMDVSITVREAHFTQNTFGNMARSRRLYDRDQNRNRRCRAALRR